MSGPRRAVVFAAALAAGGPGGLAAGPIEVPAYQVFEAMLAYCAAGRLDRLKALVKASGALVDEVDAVPAAGVRRRLESALAGNDRAASQAAVRRLVFFHMKLEFGRALAERRSRPARLRLAYFDFLFLKPALAPPDARSAEDEFKSAHESLLLGAEGWRPAVAARLARVEALCAGVLADGD